MLEFVKFTCSSFQLILMLLCSICLNLSNSLSLIYDLQANKKTRNRAYEIIVQIGHACVDEDKGGNKENLYDFFNMVKKILDNNTLVCCNYKEVIMITGF